MTDRAHVEALLSPVADASPPIRIGHTRSRPIPYLETEGEYAPVRFRAQCRDATGYARRRHSWDRDGVCVFCSRRRPGPVKGFRVLAGKVEPFS